MNPRVWDLAAAVIAKVDREHPADAVLRSELRVQKGLLRELGGAVSQAVFAYYRWWGWREQGAGVKRNLEAAWELDQRYREHPNEFPDHDLLARAVPAWVKDQADLSPAWARWLQAKPVLWIRARAGQGSEVASRLGDCLPAGSERLADALEYRGRKDLFRTPEFQAGAFELQDLHSQAVGWLCAPRPGETWWDACAGEGGKTLHLSSLMHNQGLIWASDRADWRLRRLKLRAARAGVFNYRSALWNGGLPLPTKTRFDGVLVDAPCSNLGTWQRNPHARWTTTPADVEELAALQLQLLTAVASAVKPGGRLVYAVCTLTRAETVGVAADFLSRCPQFSPLPTANPLATEGDPAAQHLLLPRTQNANAMFVAIWRRGDAPAKSLGGPSGG